MFKKIIAVIVCAMMIVIPTSASAEELQGKVMSLEYNEKAPYAGILLDPIAASKMIVDRKYISKEIELELRKEFQKDLSDRTLSLNLVEAELQSLRDLHAKTIELKDNQIDQLQMALKDEVSDDHTEWWALGGVLIGIALSVAVFYASVEVAK